MYYLKALRDIFTEIFQENKFQRKLFDAKSRNSEIKHKKIRKIIILFIINNQFHIILLDLTKFLFELQTLKPKLKVTKK